jgi:hypothetical protein
MLGAQDGLPIMGELGTEWRASYMPFRPVINLNVSQNFVPVMCWPRPLGETARRPPSEKDIFNSLTGKANLFTIFTSAL